MKKRFLFNIGFATLILTLGIKSAYAVSPYCIPDPNRPSQAGSPYYKSYCQISKSRDSDETFETVANQLGFEDKDTIEKILNFEPFSWKDVPTAALEKIYKNSNRESFKDIDRYKIYKIVRETYDRENQYAQMKSSIAGKLKAKETWMDGSLSNGPFDVIVDLNLIDVVLFGSLATWKADAYAFPVRPDDDAEVAGSNPPTIDAEASTPDSGSAGRQESDAVAPLAEGAEPTIQEIVCIDPIDSTDPLLSYLVTADKPNCGDGTIQADEAEICDDGNTVAGDGCDAQCNPELSGNSLMCTDPYAVTLTDYAPNEDATVKIDGIDVPTVTTPTVVPGYSGCEAPAVAVMFPLGQAPATPESDQTEYPQSPNYPGPFIGGVLQEFPPSKRPFCPEGTSEFTVTLLGKEKKTCLPLDFCASFDDIRETIQPGYKTLPKDDPSRQAIESIEAIFCANVTTESRAESPYALNEGCIDCHLAAINDVMEEMRSLNVAPLENTKQAFAISNKFGPTFSLGFNTYEKGKKIKPFISNASPPDQQVDRLLKEAEELRCGTDDPYCIQPLPATPANTSFETILAPLIENKEENDMRFADTIKSFRSTRGAADDQHFTKSMKVLNDFHNAFKKLQAVYSQLAVMEPKPICKKC